MGVTLTKIVEKMELRNLTPDVDMTQREVKIPDINRPALQLAGFFDHFDCERIQLIGYVEYTYLQTLEYEHKMKIYDTGSGKICRWSHYTCRWRSEDKSQQLQR